MVFSTNFKFIKTTDCCNVINIPYFVIFANIEKTLTNFKNSFNRLSLIAKVLLNKIILKVKWFPKIKEKSYNSGPTRIDF